MRAQVVVPLLVGVLCLSVSLQAAETYGFGRISNNSSVNPEAQFFMDVSDAGNEQVSFHFYNVGPARRQFAIFILITERRVPSWVPSQALPVAVQEWISGLGQPLGICRAVMVLTSPQRLLPKS